MRYDIPIRIYLFHCAYMNTTNSIRTCIEMHKSHCCVSRISNQRIGNRCASSRHLPIQISDGESNFEFVRCKAFLINWHKNSPRLDWVLLSFQVQVTDFENAAYAVFIVLLTRAIMSFGLNFYMPISKVVCESLQGASRFHLFI